MAAGPTRLGVATLSKVLNARTPRLATQETAVIGISRSAARGGPLASWRTRTPLHQEEAYSRSADSLAVFRGQGIDDASAFTRSDAMRMTGVSAARPISWAGAAKGAYRPVEIARGVKSAIKNFLDLK